MKTGTYGSGNTDFRKLVVKKLPMHFFNTTDYHSAGCGATAISLLTGVSPFDKSVRRKGGNYPDSFMLRKLRESGISVYEVNKANLTNQKEWGHRIKDNNVVLFSSLITKKESSWIINYNRVWIHNFEIIKADIHGLLSFPIETMYVLYKKQWAK